jgi:hypothetical protein
MHQYSDRASFLPPKSGLSNDYSEDGATGFSEKLYIYSIL